MVKEINRDNHVPLYIQIKNNIIAELDRGVLKPGDAFPSLAELSRKYKVSLITSRRVISDLASEGYLETCKGQKTLVTERNYQKMLPAGLRKNIAVTFPAPAGGGEINPATMPWTNEILMGIQHCLKSAGFFSTLIPLGDDKAENRKVIGGCMNDFDGFILFSEYDNSDIDLLENNAKAYVMIDRLNENTENNYVSADYYGGSREVADYLLGLGIRSYLILLSNINHYSDLYKLRGFQETLMRKGISPAAIDIRETGKIDAEAGFEAAVSYLKEKKSNPPGAIFTTGDYLAWGALRACEKMGLKIPQDISVIGSTGLEIARVMKPSLSVIHTPMFEMGETAVEMLLRMIKSKICRIPGETLPMRFVVRESIGRKQKALKQEEVLETGIY